MFLALNDFERQGMPMKTFTTNHGLEIQAENTKQAFETAIEKQLQITAEIVGCPVKVHYAERFQIPARKVDATVLILVPDLPEFVTNAIPNPPHIRVPLAIQTGQPKGEKFEIQNANFGGQPFVYSGTWEEVASRHAYFLAACQLIQNNEELSDQLFITCDSFNDEGENLIRSGLVHMKGECQGSSDVRGVRLP